jgi:hypothetical protein
VRSRATSQDRRRSGEPAWDAHGLRTADLKIAHCIGRFVKRALKSR